MRILSLLTGTVYLLLLSSNKVTSASTVETCTSVLSSSDGTDTYTGLCNDVWSTLKPLVRPTQPQVGYAWVQYKLDKDFTSVEAAQKELDVSVTPALLGPTENPDINAIYIVDDHHTYCALDASGYDTVTATINILRDLRNETVVNFWKYIANHNYSMMASHPLGQPNTLPLPMTYENMPTVISFTNDNKTLTDDPWRSLVGYSRKVKTAPSPAPSCGSSKKCCARCFYRGCGDGSNNSGPSVPFFEFRWSYYTLTAYLDSSWWDSSSDYKTFQKAYQNLPYPSNFGQIDTNAWIDTASLLVPLCRGDTTGTYLLPVDIFEGATNLPGYTRGYTELDADPTCEQPS